MEKKRIVAATVTLLLLFVHGALGQSSVRITTWNLQWFPNGSVHTATAEQQEHNIEAAAHVLRSLDSDILLLQEVRDLKTCERLAAAIEPNTYQVAVCSKFDGRQQEAILAKYPARAAFAERWKSAEGIDPPRGFAFAWFTARGADFGVYCVHLKSNLVRNGDTNSVTSLNIRKREAAVKQLLEHVDGAIAEQMPTIRSVIIGGDFNTNPDQPIFAAEKTLKMLSNAGFIDCAKNLSLNRRITHPGKNGYPDATFDYLFVRGGMPAKPPLIAPTGSSDHFPVTCEFQLLPAVANMSADISESTQPNGNTVDVEVGQPLNLQQFDGPNVDLIVFGTDIANVSLGSRDYDHLNTVVSNGVASTVPTWRTWQVKRATGFAGIKTPLYEADHVRVFFVDAMDVRQNHAILEIDRR